MQLTQLAELTALSAQVVPKSTVTESRRRGNDDFDELLDKYMDANSMYTFEGPRGMRNFEKIIRAVGEYGSVDAFFSDNSGAFEALIEWMKSNAGPEWVENLKKEVGVDEKDDE